MGSLLSQTALTAAAMLLALEGVAGGPRERLVFRPPSELEFAATVHRRAFEDGLFMPRYHALVWEGGRAARQALLRAEVSDVEVIQGLERLGAKAGDNLPMDTWDERRNEHHPAPDRIIQGTDIEILLRLPGRGSLVPLAQVLADPGGRGLQMRFGGNRRNIPEWKSGCIVCLYSCPGSKVGNARYTVRDYVRKTTRFGVRGGVLPADGTRIHVVFRVRRSAP